MLPLRGQTNWLLGAPYSSLERCLRCRRHLCTGKPLARAHPTPDWTRLRWDWIGLDWIGSDRIGWDCIGPSESRPGRRLRSPSLTALGAAPAQSRRPAGRPPGGRSEDTRRLRVQPGDQLSPQARRAMGAAATIMSSPARKGVSRRWAWRSGLRSSSSCPLSRRKRRSVWAAATAGPFRPV